MEEGSGIVLVLEFQANHDEACCPTEMARPPDDLSEGPCAPCLWWRRGRVCCSQFEPWISYPNPGEPGPNREQQEMNHV